MLSTLDPNRQANEVIFSRKSKFSSYPPLSSPLLLSPLTFNNNDFKKCSHQKHLGSILDSKLDFNTRVDNKIKKCYQIICLIKRLSVSVPRKALLTICKSFIRPLLDYGDILSDKPENRIFQNKLEKD